MEVKQKLVMLYTFSNGVDCWPRVYPFFSESPESAIVDFEEKYQKAKITQETFVFAGEEFYSCDFEENGVYYAPQFLTIDMWFSSLNLK